MRNQFNQQPEMLPHPRQPPTSREMQLWQQHLTYKQLQELQMQQQFQQLDQGARQSNLPSQGGANQLPALMNGMPVNDASSRGSPLLQGSNRFMFSSDHGQVMRSMGFVSQQNEQSLYGTPVSSSRGLLDQFSQFQSSNFTDVMTKSGGNQLMKTPMQAATPNSFDNDQRVPVQACLQDGLSSTAQCFQGNGLSGNVRSENFQHVNHPQLNVQIQDVHSREGQVGWSGILDENAATVVGPSHGVTSLDPTEEKILFGSDDGNWGASLSAGGFLLGNPLDDQANAFPSIQSGSWSALMQEAVEASSSDQGFQEEWSGLSFQKTEPSFMNHSAVYNDIGKHQAAWNSNDSKKLPDTSSATLRAFPLCNEATADSSSPTDRSFHHSVRATYEHTDQTHTDASHESSQQSSKDVQDMHVSQSPKQKKFVDGGLQGHMQLNDVPNGVWLRHMYEQSVKTADAAGLEFNSLNNQSIWAHQRLPFPNVTSQVSANPDSWNKPLASSGGNSLEVHGNDGRVLYGQNELKRTSYINQNMDQFILNRRQADLMKRAAFDSFLKSRGENAENYQHQPSVEQHAQDSVVNEIDRPPSNSQTSSGFSGWKSVGSRRFQYQQNEISTMNLETVDSAKDTSYSHGLSQSVIPDSQNQGQDYLGHSQFTGVGVSNMVKGHSTELQRNVNGPKEAQHQSTTCKQDFPMSAASFDESSSGLAQNTKTYQTSQNMLELLNKVDQSGDSSIFPGFHNSNRSTLDGTHGSAGSAGSHFHPQHHQTSAFQGFGLQMAPQPQQQSNESLHHAQEASQREIQDSRSNLSRETCKQVPHSVAQGNSLVVTASDLPYRREQLQLQQKQQFMRQQILSSVMGRETDVDENVRLTSFPRQADDSHDQSINLSARKPLPNMAIPFRLTSTTDIHAPGSEFNSHKTESSQLINAGLYHLKNSGVQPPREGTGPVLQASAASSMSQSSPAKNGQESFHGLQAELVSLPNAASPNSNMVVHGHSMMSSVVQHPNYSLLQQNQAMRGADSDVIKIVGKRMKGDFSSDTSQGYVYGPNAVNNRAPADDELNTASRNSFLPDVKMLNFSSRENEEKFAGGGSQIIGRDMPSQDSVQQHDLQIQIQPLSSTSNYMRRIEHPQISPQMARSWLENYRKYKNGQIFAMHDDPRNAGVTPQQYCSADAAERLGSYPSVDQRIESSQFSSLVYATSPSPRTANELSPQLSLDAVDHETIVRSKKRKTATSEIIPWHQLVVQGFRRLQSISSAERGWAQVTNRLPEKLEEEVELTEDAALVPRAKRRLILTTQLMQQLIPPVPASIFVAEVASSFEHVTYFLAKSALGDACSSLSCLGSDSREQLDSGNRILDKAQTTSEVFFSKIVEEFMGRSRKMEGDLLRLDKRTSLIDVRLGCEDLGRFSLVNRLGKFHGRSQADGAESSSASQNTARKIFPQRYVTGLPMPGNLPEGVTCLSL